MLGEWTKPRALLIAGGALAAVLAGFLTLQRGQPLALGRAVYRSDGDDALAKMRELLSRDRRLLAGYEKEQARLRAQVIQLRKLYQNGQVEKQEVENAERVFVAALRRVHEMRNSVVEADIAIAEAVWGQKVDRMPAVPLNGYNETKELARFNGGFKWSIKEAPQLEKFFAQTFGRRLPITALGQSETHNRLRFDHRDSMDVALHPDSAEGRALIEHLKKTGIPFIAFRGAVPGASTGAHIHIGKPSRRL